MAGERFVEEALGQVERGAGRWLLTAYLYSLHLVRLDGRLALLGHAVARLAGGGGPRSAASAYAGGVGQAEVRTRA